jgi:hypothetical protein
MSAIAVAKNTATAGQKATPTTISTVSGMMQTV